jgi:hypothetical protein
MKIADALKGQPRPTLEALVKFLDKLPASEVFPTRDLEAMSPPGSISNFRRYKEVQAFQFKFQGKLFWGSKKAIAELRAGAK